MRITSIKSLLALAALSALGAHAATQPAAAPAPAAMPDRAAARFDALDTNKDGSLSREEFLAGRHTMARQGGQHAGKGAGMHEGMHGGGLTRLPVAADGTLARSEVEKLNRPPMLARFDALDTNKDGVLSAAERAAAPQQRPAR